MRSSRFSNGLFVLLIIVSAAWVLHTLSGILVVGIDDLRFTRHKIENGFEFWPGWRSLLFVHALFAVVAILAGISAFVLRRRQKWSWHRNFGKIYVVAVAISAFSSLPLALTATGGLISTIGFFALAFLWAYCTGTAFLEARRRNFQSHLQWMIRSYGLTLANTTLHVSLMPLTSLTGDRLSAYQIAVWFCIVFNLSVSELIVRTKKLNQANTPLFQENTRHR